jgi:hypothetical protein
LRLPQNRQLEQARSFWRHVREVMGKAGKSESFRDIYSGQRLEAEFPSTIFYHGAS